jgi:FKBP12-rapamycin complex-associated protein
MTPHIPQLLPLIIDTLQDQSSVVKREVALRTLGQLAESSGTSLFSPSTTTNRS